MSIYPPEGYTQVFACAEATCGKTIETVAPTLEGHIGQLQAQGWRHATSADYRHVRWFCADHRPAGMR